MEGVVLDRHRLQRARQRRAGDNAIPHRRPLLPGRAARELQMDPHARHLPGRPIPARIAGAARAHVRDRHDVGRDVQGSRVLQLLHRGAQGAQALQVLDCVFASRHSRHDRPSCCAVRPA